MASTVLADRVSMRAGGGSGARRRATLVALGAALMLWGAASPAGGASVPRDPSPSYTVNGAVTAIERVGDTIYIGGAFTRVSTAAGNAAVVDGSTARISAPVPHFRGQVTTSISDGAGGWYVGGSFRAVGDAPRRYLVRIRADGSVDRSFDPALDGPVRALLLRDGQLYVGGLFSRARGLRSESLVRVDPATGAADAGWRPQMPGPVLDITATATYVYAIWADHAYDPDFSMQARGVASVHRASGATLANAVRSAGDARSLAVGDDGTVYVAGSGVVAHRPDGRRLRARWTWYEAQGVDDIVVSGTRLYGVFGADDNDPDEYNTLSMGDDGVLVLDAATGAEAKAFPRVFDGSVHSLAVAGGVVYVAGRFSGVYDDMSATRPRPQMNVAAFNAASGALLDWNPEVGGAVATIAHDGGSNLFLGGAIPTVGGVERQRLAAIDAVTGEVRPDFRADVRDYMDPNVSTARDSPIRDLHAVGDVLYVGGAFRSIGGVRAAGLAAIDLDTGTVLPSRAPGITHARTDLVGIKALATHRSTMFVAGSFVRLGGQRRLGFGAFDMRTGRVLPMSAPSNLYPIWDMAAHGGNVWLGGHRRSDTSGRDSTRRSIAVLDARTGRTLRTPADTRFWGIAAMTGAQGSMYVMGRAHNRDFTDAMHVFDARTGRELRTIRLSGGYNLVGSMVADDRHVVLGAEVWPLGPTHADTQWLPSWWRAGARQTPALRIVDLRTGRVRRVPTATWDDHDQLGRGLAPYHSRSMAFQAGARHTAGVESLELHDGRLYVGGDFTALGGIVQPNFAAFTTFSNAPPACDDARVGTVPNTPVVVDVRCTDPDGSALSHRVVSASDGANAVLDGARLSVTPSTSAALVSVVVEARDRHGAVGTATVLVDVRALDVAPVCDDIALEVRDDVPTRIDLRCQGWDAGLTWKLVGQPEQGRLNQFDPAGSVRYVPTGRYAGSDAFTAEAANAASISVRITVRLTVISVRGTSGNDQLTGGQDSDRINAGAGDDTVRAGAGNDRVDGGIGNDRIHAGGGRDLIIGNHGDDVIVTFDRSRDVVVCGRGTDTVVADRSDVGVGCERVVRRTARRASGVAAR